MSNFLSNIVANHTASVPMVQPRLPGRFETQEWSPASELEDLPSINQHTGYFGKPQDLPQQKAFKNQAHSIAIAKKIVGTESISDALSQQYLNSVKEPGLAPSILQIKPDNDATLSPLQHKLQPEEPSFRFAYDNQGTNKDSPPVNTELPKHKQVFAQKETVVNGSLYPYNKSTHLLNVQPVEKDLMAPIRQKGEGQSVIKVSIGRIDVRAISATAPVKQNPVPVKASHMSLDDYFNKKKNP